MEVKFFKGKIESKVKSVQSQVYNTKTINSDLDVASHY